MLEASKMVEVIKEDIVTLMKRVEELEGVIHHCWIHSGYKDCGASKMTSRELDLYQDAVRAESLRLDGMQ